MARPRADGTPSRAINRRKLTDLFVSTRKAAERDELIWDVKQPGLALSVRTTGKKAWKVIYRFHGRPRWLHLGDVRSIGLADARRLTAQAVLDVIEGRDPAAQRKAERLTGTFADLASQYVELWAKKHNKSWKQAERLVQRHLLPPWGRLKASAISRADVRAVMVRIGAPIVANQVLAAASAIFSWAIRQEIVAVNPVVGVDRNPTASRERVLSDAEIKVLYENFDPALKLILLTGQRPGEIAAMQRGHIVESWWNMPGKPKGDWPGTKNGRDHRVALSDSALDLVEVHLADKGGANRSSTMMKKLVAEFGIERATPHDLRRTCLTSITRLGFGRDAMDRIANHKTGKVTDVYDRWGYEDEDRRIMAAIARHVASLVEETGPTNVVALR